MILRILSLALLFAISWIYIAEASSYFRSRPVLLCLFDKSWVNCSDVPINHLKQKTGNHKLYRILRHVLRPNHDVRRNSQRLLAPQLLNRLSLHNRHKLERHVGAIREVLNPVFNTIYPQRRHKQLHHNTDKHNIVKTIVDYSVTTMVEESPITRAIETTRLNKLEKFISLNPDVALNGVLHSSTTTEKFAESTNNILNLETEKVKQRWQILSAFDHFDRKFYNVSTCKK
jgi:hypothetical protein